METTKDLPNITMPSKADIVSLKQHARQIILDGDRDAAVYSAEQVYVLISYVEEQERIAWDSTLGGAMKDYQASQREVERLRGELEAERKVHHTLFQYGA